MTSAGLNQSQEIGRLLSWRSTVLIWSQQIGGSVVECVAETVKLLPVTVLT